MMLELYLSSKRDKALKTLKNKSLKKVLTRKNSFDKIKKLKQANKNFEN